MDRRRLKTQIPSEKLETGASLATENAKRLAADAKFNFQNGRHAIALALATLSLEEIGKAKLLSEASRESVSITLWDIYNHKKKLQTAMKLLKPLFAKPTPQNVLEGFEVFAELAATNFERQKEIGLYVDYDPVIGGWTLPESSFGPLLKSWADGLIFLCDTILELQGSYSLTS